MNINTATATSILTAQYELTRNQRAALAASFLRDQIIQAVRDDEMSRAGQLLMDAGIIGLVQMIDGASRDITEIAIF